MSRRQDAGGRTIGARRAVRRRALVLGGLATAAALLSGCGQQYVLLHPAGPVGRTELNLMYLAGAAMGVVILFVFALLAVTAYRFRDRPDRQAPYLPHFHGNRRLEITWFIIPALILTVIAVPMVHQTYALAKVPDPPAGSSPVVVDVTSLTWKWLFEYPGQHIATVNYLDIPAGQPVLFELTADSPMNTFWVPELGGMEYTMPGRVLPLYLTAQQPGIYPGRSGQFSGRDFEKMFFNLKALSPSAFTQWISQVKATEQPMTTADYQALLQHNTTGIASYSSYPSDTFPTVNSGFSLKGGMYTIGSNGQPAGMGSGA